MLYQSGRSICLTGAVLFDKRANLFKFSCLCFHNELLHFVLKKLLIKRAARFLSKVVTFRVDVTFSSVTEREIGH